MTLKEFNDFLYSQDFPKNESLLVFIANEGQDVFSFFTEILLARLDSSDPGWYWADDWYMKYKNVEILGYVPISQVHRFIPLNCEHKLHMVGEDHLINEFLEEKKDISI